MVMDEEEWEEDIFKEILRTANVLDEKGNIIQENKTMESATSTRPQK